MNRWLSLLRICVAVERWQLVSKTFNQPWKKCRTVSSKFLVGQFICQACKTLSTLQDNGGPLCQTNSGRVHMPKLSGMFMVILCREQRLKQLKEDAANRGYGAVISIVREQFVSEVTQGSKDVWTVVHLYKDKYHPPFTMPTPVT